MNQSTIFNFRATTVSVWYWEVVIFATVRFHEFLADRATSVAILEYLSLLICVKDPFWI